MSTFFIVWAILGMIFTVAEHFSYDWDFAEMSKTKIALNIVHQLVHYSRCIIVWPWYLVEDMLLVLDNKLHHDDDDNDDIDGMIP